MLCSGSRATPALGPNQIAPEFPNMLAVGVCVEGLDYLEVPGASVDVASSNSGCSACHVDPGSSDRCRYVPQRATCGAAAPRHASGLVRGSYGASAARLPRANTCDVQVDRAEHRGLTWRVAVGTSPA